MYYTRILQIFAILVVVLCLTDAAPVKSKTKSKAVAKKPVAKKLPAKKPAPLPPSRPVSPVPRPASPAGKATTPKKATTKKTTSPPPSRPASPAGKADSSTAAKGKSTVTSPPPSRTASPANGKSGSGSTPKTGTQPDADDTCSRKTTCEPCLKAKCSFDVKGKKCFAKNTPLDAGAIIASGQPAAKKCKDAADELKKESTPTSQISDLEFQQAAARTFGRLQRHVLGTNDNAEPTSGRHLASSFIKIPENVKNYKRKRNPDTGLSQFTKIAGDGPQTKTTWDDDDDPKKYTSTDVRSICQTAIEAVLRLQDSKTLSSTAITSISVRPPGKDFNICVTVQKNTSVFPKNTEKTTKASGEKC
ncbi:hypothetical protein V5O48_013054 [Marasmius crinis-equi]|uniref:Uncharacterized protein n=1 Tax=Marasmius crinis-equi TaxID=585013 RepID=A0ABR3F1G3_9AGAR